MLWKKLLKFLTSLVLVMTFNTHLGNSIVNDCSSFSAAPWTGIQYAYKFFSSSLTNSAAQKYCNDLGFSGSRLAISRSRESTIFMWTNVTQPYISAGSSAYIGLLKSGTNWTWLDGKNCNNGDPRDERCYGSCSFDGSGKYVVFYNISLQYCHIV
jgi:hypothetical protein